MTQPPVDDLGPEATSLAPDELAELFGPHPMRLHGFLRDQRILSGLGRRLANEICYEARLSPFTETSRLGLDEAKTIDGRDPPGSSRTDWPTTGAWTRCRNRRPGRALYTVEKASGVPTATATTTSGPSSTGLHRELLPDPPDRGESSGRQHHGKFLK